MKTFTLSSNQKLVAFSAVVISAMLFSILSKNTSPVVAPVEASSAVTATINTVVQTNAMTPQTVTQPLEVAAPVISVNASKKVWQSASPKAAAPSIKLNERIVAFEAIEIEQHPESLPQVGEKIEVPMLNGAKVVVDVQFQSSNPNGDKTWSGHVEGFGTDYPVIMTYGEHSIFAMITTPEGSYTMESVEGAGWLYKNPSELELSSTNSKDFLEVPNVL